MIAEMSFYEDDFVYPPNEIRKAIDLGGFYRASIEKDTHFFHYTDKQGLEGILRSQELWATDYRYLNDENEFAIVEASIPEAIANLQLEKSIEKYLEKKLIEEIHRQNSTVRQEQSFFVTCFSLNGDSLLLWSEFASRLGCNLEIHQRHVHKVRPGIIRYPGKVIYNRLEQLRVIQESFFHMLPRATTVKKLLEYFLEENLEKEMNQYITSVALLCRYYSMFMKDQVYSDEMEYRVVYKIIDDSVKVRYREKAGFPERIPYIGIPVAPENEKIPIESICLNPKLHGFSVQKEYRSMCEKLGYSIPIKESRAALRY